MSQKITFVCARFHNGGIDAMLIDPYSENWLEHLVPSSHSESASDPVYLLVDGVFLPGLHRLIKGLLAASQSPSLLFETLPGCSEQVQDVSPFLFQYEPANAQLEALLAKCSGWPMISAIKTRETQAELSERLVSWCVVEVDHQRFNLRFPDTRRLSSIFNALTDKQRAEFSGPASQWKYIDRNGAWGELVVPGTPSAVTACARLDNQQFAELVSASEVDEVITLLQDRGVHATGLHSHHYATVDIALRVANEANLDPMSKLSWCEEWLAGGASLHQVHAARQLASWMSKALSSEAPDPHSKETR